MPQRIRPLTTLTRLCQQDKRTPRSSQNTFPRAAAPSYIVATFPNQTTESIFKPIFQRDFRKMAKLMRDVPHWPGAVMSTWHSVNGVFWRAPDPVDAMTHDGSPLWVLDYEVRRDLGHVVPQAQQIRFGQAHSMIDADMLIFFVHEDGSVGLPLVRYSDSEVRLRGGNDTPLGRRKFVDITVAV